MLQRRITAQTLLSIRASATHWPGAGDFALRAVHARVVGVEVLVARTRRGRGRVLSYVSI